MGGPQRPSMQSLVIKPLQGRPGVRKVELARVVVSLANLPLRSTDADDAGTLIVDPGKVLSDRLKGCDRQFRPDDLVRQFDGLRRMRKVASSQLSVQLFEPMDKLSDLGTLFDIPSNNQSVHCILWKANHSRVKQLLQSYEILAMSQSGNVLLSTNQAATNRDTAIERLRIELALSYPNLQLGFLGNIALDRQASPPAPALLMDDGKRIPLSKLQGLDPIRGELESWIATAHNTGFSGTSGFFGIVLRYWGI